MELFCVCIRGLETFCTEELSLKLCFHYPITIKEHDNSGLVRLLLQEDSIWDSNDSITSLLLALKELRSVMRICIGLGQLSDLPFTSSSSEEEATFALRGRVATLLYGLDFQEKMRICQLSWLPICFKKFLHDDFPVMPTFRVSCERNRQFKPAKGIGTPEIERALGSGVVKQFGWKVDCKNHDLEIYADLTQNTLMVGLTLPGLVNLHKAPHRRIEGCQAPTVLNASLAYSLVIASRLRPGEILCDPCCGIGTIPFEAIHYCPEIITHSGDISEEGIYWAKKRQETAGYLAKKMKFQVWNADSLSEIEDNSIDLVISDLPFGHRHGNNNSVGILYRHLLNTLTRILRQKSGRAVLLAMSKKSMLKALESCPKNLVYDDKFGNGTGLVEILIGNLRADVLGNYNVWKPACF